MTTKLTSSDPDIRASLTAMKRAARNAKKLAQRMGTPLYVLKDGRVVNLNPRTRSRSQRTK